MIIVQDGMCEVPQKGDQMRSKVWASEGGYSISRKFLLAPN